MSTIKNKSLRVEPKITLELTESEMRALEALAGYSTDEFLKLFYKHMGEHYLKPHETALRGLFETFRKEFNPLLGTTDTARQILERELKK